jgi:TfoX/Sxy family transcriptional regulator of competence genes
MFGGIGFLVNGNMACGVNNDDLIVRLSEHDFEEALKHGYVRVFNMTGRPMKGWIMISSGGYTADTRLKAWIDKAVAHARSLPPK